MRKVKQLLFLLLITSVFFIALGCGGDKSDKSTTKLPETRFKDPADAASRLSYSIKGNIGRSPLEMFIKTEEEVSGSSQIEEGKAPKVAADSIKEILTYIRKSPRISRKHGFSIDDFFSCEKVEPPECTEGKVEKFDCKSGGDEKLEMKWIRLEVALSECKEEYETESKGQNVKITEIRNGYMKVYIEIIKDRRFKIEADGDITVSKLHNGELKLKARTKPSQFKIESYIESIKRELSGDQKKFIQTIKSVGAISGKLLVEDLIKNRKEEHSFYDLKTRAETKYIISEYSTSYQDEGTRSEPSYPEYSAPEVKMEISGIYSIETSPDSCVEGTFKYETIEPITPSYKSDCPVAGKIKVNNSILEFSSDKVIISVDNQQKIYSCEEFFNLCQYEPIGIRCGATNTGGLNLILVLITSFILFIVRKKII
jgi:hypothetical protein